MARKIAPSNEPGLFDLPLRPRESTSSSGLAGHPDPLAKQVSIDLDSPRPLFPAAEDDPARTSQGNETSTPGQAIQIHATLKGRLLAGLFDLGLLLLVGLFCIASMGLLGVDARSISWPPFGLFLLSFSFLYHVIPLSFWGRTPGMAFAGLTARNADDLPLSIGQTGLRWIGTLLTLVLIGLPALLVFTGTSLTDRISGSRTLAPSTNT